MFRGKPSLPLWRRVLINSALPTSRAGAPTRQQHCFLHTSANALLRRTPTRLARAPSSASSAADSLLSQWSRRSKTSVPPKSDAAANESASPAAHSPVVGNQDELAGRGFSVEELLGFEEDSSLPTTTTTITKQRNDAATPPRSSVLSDASSYTLRTASTAESHPQPAHVEDVVDAEDADVYGMAASAAVQESELIEDLLRQAAVDSSEAEEDTVEEPAASAAFSSSSSPLSNDNEDASVGSAAMPRVLKAPQSEGDAFVSSHSTQSAAEESSEEDAQETVRAVEEEEDARTPAASGERDEEDEDGSMDTVLEEETERMLQAALANMMKESAVRTAGAAAGASGTSSAVKGTDGYVFFTKEAVMAAAASLATSERAAHGGSDGVEGVSGGSISEGAAGGDGVTDFDDDVVRAVEMETLGLDVETTKR